MRTNTVRRPTTAAVGGVIVAGVLALLAACGGGTGHTAGIAAGLPSGSASPAPLPSAPVTAPSSQTVTPPPTYTTGHGATPTSTHTDSPTPSGTPTTTAPPLTSPVIDSLTVGCRQSPTGVWTLVISYRVRPDTILVTVTLYAAELDHPQQIYTGGSVATFTYSGEFCRASVGPITVTASTYFNGTGIQAIRTFTGTAPDPTPTGPPVKK